MNEAEVLFNEVASRCFNSYRIVLSFREVASKGIPAAQRILAAEHYRFVMEIMMGPEFEKVIVDKEAFFKAMPPERFTQQLTASTVRDAQASVDAASLIFMHSMLDAAALDLCRVTSLAAPTEWFPYVQKRKVSLEDIQKVTSNELIKKELDGLFEELDGKSLLHKTDQLFRICRPEKGWQPLGGYEFDPDRLKRLDELRHEIVHGTALGQETTGMDDEVEFLFKTAFFFVSLVNHRYGMRIVPEFMMHTMAGVSAEKPPAKVTGAH